MEVFFQSQENVSGIDDCSILDILKSKLSARPKT